jgi:phenylacetate-CoA ligase
VSAFELDDKHLGLILSEMERYNLQYLWGYPGSLYHIAKYAKKNGWNGVVKSAVTWGDTLFPHYRKEIEEAFHTTVFDTYGCGEGFQIAAQCECGNYHLQALDVIAEFVNDEGLSVKPGEEGNILITRLHPGPMPLIRYFVGDRGIPFENETCPCGRSFPLLKSIVGRTADVVLTPSLNRLIVHFFTGVLEHFPIIDTFQIVQEKMDFIRLRIVPTSPLSEEMKNTIINSLKSNGCSDLDIEIEIVEKINLPPSGKHRFVISHIN